MTATLVPSVSFPGAVLTSSAHDLGTAGTTAAGGVGAGFTEVSEGGVDEGGSIWASLASVGFGALGALGFIMGTAGGVRGSAGTSL